MVSKGRGISSLTLASHLIDVCHPVQDWIIQPAAVNQILAPSPSLASGPARCQQEETWVLLPREERHRTTRHKSPLCAPYGLFTALRGVYAFGCASSTQTKGAPSQTGPSSGTFSSLKRDPCSPNPHRLWSLMQGIAPRCVLSDGLESGGAVVISIMVHPREICATSEPPVLRRAVSLRHPRTDGSELRT